MKSPEATITVLVYFSQHMFLVLAKIIFYMSFPNQVKFWTGRGFGLPRIMKFQILIWEWIWG